MILLIDNYDSFTYNLFQYVAALGEKVLVRRNDKITVPEIAILNPSGILISPGPGRPEDAGVCISLIKEFSGCLPILGVCLGHQAIAAAFGCSIAPSFEIVHGRDGLVRHSGKGLFKGLASPFPAARYHSLAVPGEGLPGVLKIDADLEDGTVMAISHKTHPTFGVQFHPESVFTPGGPALLENFLAHC